MLMSVFMKYVVSLDKNEIINFRCLLIADSFVLFFRKINEKKFPLLFINYIRLNFYELFFF